MSVNSSDPHSETAPVTPATATCANYMGCRHCEEGSLVYDPDVGSSRCRSCGELD